MSRENSPLIVGDYWLDKRRDGKSPDIWQVAYYSKDARTTLYRSTKRRSLDEAGAVLRAYDAQQRSLEQGQDADYSALLPHFTNYVREKGPDITRLDTAKSSFRAWVGFLMQDRLTDGATVSDVTPGMIDRFRRWRMGPHEWTVEWGGKVFRHKSEGVTGHAVQRNIEDLRAALNYAEGEKRIVAPRIPSVHKRLRQKGETRYLTPAQLGALWGYARGDTGIWRELALMMATACRPGAAMAFDPAVQWHDDTLDLHPVDRAENDKRNAMVPLIAPLKPILEEWRDGPHKRVHSRKTWWRTARRALGMEGVEAYDIRHTILTLLDEEGVPGAQISGFAGHIPESRQMARTTSQHYVRYDPARAQKAVAVLTKFFKEVERQAALWSAGHSRSIPVRGKPIKVAKTGGQR